MLEAVAQRCSVKKGVLRNFAKFTGKHLCQSLFFNKVAGPRPAALLKKRLWHSCFPLNFVKFLRTPFLTKHFWWLLLQCFFKVPNMVVFSILYPCYYTVLFLRTFPIFFSNLPVLSSTFYQCL